MGARSGARKSAVIVHGCKTRNNETRTTRVFETNIFQSIVNNINSTKLLWAKEHLIINTVHK